MWGQYIGLEYVPGVMDCWRLVRQVYAEVYGINLPLITVEQRAVRTYWRCVEWEITGDVLLFKTGRRRHVGIVTEPGRMLHIEAGITSCIERYNNGLWKPRLQNIYRHRALM